MYARDWRQWIWEYGYRHVVPGKESKKIQLVTSQVHAFIYKIMFEQLHFIPYVQKNLIFRSFCVNRYKLVSSSRNLLKRHVNMFSMSTWHDGRMRSLEYVEIHFLVVLYLQLLILLRTTLCNLKMRSKVSIITLSRFPWWCISHIGMAQTVVKSKEKF